MTALRFEPLLLSEKELALLSEEQRKAYFDSLQEITPDKIAAMGIPQKSMPRSAANLRRRLLSRVTTK